MQEAGWGTTSSFHIQNYTFVPSSYEHKNCIQYFLGIKFNKVSLRVLWSKKKCIISEVVLAFAVQEDNVFTAKYILEGMAWIYAVFISYLFISK